MLTKKGEGEAGGLPTGTGDAVGSSIQEQAAAGELSTVADAGGGNPAAGRCRGMSTVVDAGDGVPGKGRSREHVYCSRCQLRCPCS